MTITVCLGAAAVSLAVPLWFQAHEQRLLVVTSDSMAPRIRAGDAVVIRAVTSPDQLRVGQVATFWPPGGDRLVTHTIVEIRSIADVVPDPRTGRSQPVLDEHGAPVERPFIITKGDANAENDPNATPLSRVRGTVLEIHPGWGSVIGWANSPTGRWVMLAPPLALLALLEGADAVAARRQARRPQTPRSPEEARVDALLLD